MTMMNDTLHTGGNAGDEKKAQTNIEHRGFHRMRLRHQHEVKPCKDHLYWLAECAKCCGEKFHSDEDGSVL